MCQSLHSEPREVVRNSKFSVSGSSETLVEVSKINTLSKRHLFQLLISSHHIICEVFIFMFNKALTMSMKVNKTILWYAYKCICILHCEFSYELVIFSNNILHWLFQNLVASIYIFPIALNLFCQNNSGSNILYKRPGLMRSLFVITS